MSALKWHAAVEAAAGGKVAAVAASTVALAGGGAVAGHDATEPARPAAKRTATTLAGAHGAASGTSAKRLPAYGVAPAGARLAATAPENGSVRFRAAAARRSASVRTKARSAGAGSSGGREFGVDRARPAGAAGDFAETSRRQRTVIGAGARASTRRFDTAVAPPSTATTGADFTRAAPNASRPAPLQPAPMSPAASEFGP